MELARYSRTRVNDKASKRTYWFSWAALSVTVLCAVAVFFLLRERDHWRHFTANQLRQPQKQTGPLTLPETSSSVPPPARAVQPAGESAANGRGPTQSVQPESDPAPNPEPTRNESAAGDRNTKFIPAVTPTAKTRTESLIPKRERSRSYQEFTVARSKSFQQVGPVSIQLRNADTKHGHYDVLLLVNGHRLKKNHVNLYEPIWITVNEHSPPIQLVVDGISKNQISGYLSQTRSRRSQVAQTPAPKGRTQQTHP